MILSNTNQTCHRNCKKLLHAEEKSLCDYRCDSIFRIPEPLSQISERFKAITNNIFNESRELLLMADEICALEDAPYF